MLLSSLCLFLTAQKSFSEAVDHTSSRWTGERWTPNPVQPPGTAFQGAFFPLVTQGPGRIQIPDEAFILRFGVISTNFPSDEPLMVLWGKVVDDKLVPLATLHCRKGRFVWVCPMNPKGDCLFDSKQDVQIESREALPNLWHCFDLLVSPGAFQQSLGWNEDVNKPIDPLVPGGKRVHMARQLTSAAWRLDHIEVVHFNSVWLGLVEILPADFGKHAHVPNIIGKK
jgi:hypothetical protein